MNDISQKLADKGPDAIAKRLMQKVEFRDGLQEIWIGITILMWAGLNGLVVAFQHGFLAHKGVISYFMLVMMPLPVLMGLMIKKVRQRFLIDKVGYVKLKPVKRKQLGIRQGITMGLAFIVAALAMFVTLKMVIASRNGGGVPHWGLFTPAGWVFVGTGIFAGAIMIFLVRLTRYFIGGVIMAALGILLALNGVSLNVGLTILYGFAGVFALISGSVVFFLILRQPAQEGE
jgi:hypothetical protein